MLELPTARIRVKNADSFESECVLMLDKDAIKSLLSEKYRAEQEKIIYLATFSDCTINPYNYSEMND